MVGAAIWPLALASCALGSGQASVTPSAARTSPPASAPAPSAALSPSPTPSPPLSVSLNVSFGSVYGHTGEAHCPNWYDHHDSVGLAQSRLGYTASELSRMAATVRAKSYNYDALDPSLLTVEPGVATASLPTSRPGDVASLRMSIACVLSLEITNTGAVNIQIPQAGLRLTQSPVANTARYRMVEFCSVVHSTTFCGPIVGGPPPGCQVYGVEIALSSQPPGTDVMQPPAQVDPQSGQSCPEITLPPNRSVTIVIGAYSSDALIYQATPILHVITPSGEGTVAFPQLAGVYAYADPSQFSCYRLNGTVFELWKSGAPAYDFNANQTVGAWCV